MLVRQGRLPSAVVPESTYPAELRRPIGSYPGYVGLPGDWEPAMEILGRFDGRNGQITIAQERKTGARLYVEEGVKQSYVLPGGSANLDYVRLMVRVLEGAPDVILFGCGGGALASERKASLQRSLSPNLM